MTYLITGKIKGKSYKRETSDYKLALDMFYANNLNFLWQIDQNGQRKLIKRQS